jgi:NADH:ubiquinone oxidoreductase subunit F (NADH-binding)
MAKMYIEKYTIMGAGWYIYRESTALLQSMSQTKEEEEVSVTVPDGELRIRTIGISKIILH